MTHLKKLLDWFINLFQDRYEITVSIDAKYGNSDDQKFIANKIIIQKEKHLKFRTVEDQII